MGKRSAEVELSQFTSSESAADRHARFLETRHFGSLDGLRCIAVLAVIWHHTAAPSYAHSLLATRGMEGVTLFFAISGFLITTLILREKRRRGDMNMGHFLARRSLRIFPLYYAVLALYVVLVVMLESGQEGRAFFENLPYFATYTSNWFVNLDEGRVIFYFAWSLATEEQFYLVWPWFEKWLSGSVASAVMAVALVVRYLVIFGMPGAFAAAGPVQADSFAHTVVASISPAICLGVLVAHALDSRLGFALLRRLVGYRVGSAVLFAAIVVLLSLEDGWAAHLVPVAMVLLVVSCVLAPNHYLSALLNSRVSVQVGTVSYGMYLLHMLGYNALKLVVPSSQGLLLFFAAAVLSWGAATLSFHTFERYFLGFKSRFA